MPGVSDTIRLYSYVGMRDAMIFYKVIDTSLCFLAVDLER
jgi:hypothetical protein